MALAPNRTNGKAVADIKALYFYNHAAGEPTIDDTTLQSADWFPALTLRGTVNSSQDDPSIEKINVDQFDAAIGISTEAGDFNFEAQLPSLTYYDIAKWLGKTAIAEPTDSQGNVIEIDGKQVIGFDLDGSLYDMSVLIKTRTNDVIIFSRVQVSFSFTKDDKVFVFRVTGQVLAPTNANNKMIYLATQTASDVATDKAQV